jgi:hypothetical protein
VLAAITPTAANKRVVDFMNANAPFQKTPDNIIFTPYRASA